MDESGVMRMNGRLAHSPTLSYSERFPIILPYRSTLALRLVEYTHLKCVHGDIQLMLRTLRLEYWIPRMKNLIRFVVRRCKVCILLKKRSCSQFMAALPPERTTLDRPFTNTGVDFAVPIDIKF